MGKLSFNPKDNACPMPVVIVGATVNDKPNFITVAWLSKVNNDPPMMMISLGRKKYTSEGISENKTFSINIPSKDLVKETDYCGIISGRNKDKSKLFKIFYGNTETAPMIRECQINYELELVYTIVLPGSNLFIGEIIGAYADEKILLDHLPDVIKTNPLILVSLSKEYYDLGIKIADAFNVGNKLTNNHTSLSM